MGDDRAPLGGGAPIIDVIPDVPGKVTNRSLEIAPPIIGVTVLTATMLIWLGVALAAWWFPSWFPQKTGVRGSIILSSPTIYTRQRLVNDRLSQADWLKDQLKETERDHEEKFRSIDALAVTATKNNYSAKFALPQAGSNDAPDIQTVETNNKASVTSETNRYEIEQTNLDRFLAMNMYRDTVRSDLMQTLLDDRHDIAGNTIYRLGFDATVVGGRDTDQLAIIFVTLTHRAFSCIERDQDPTHPNCPLISNVNSKPPTVRNYSGGTNTAAYSSGVDDPSDNDPVTRIIAADDYKSVYKDWVDNIRQYLITLKESILGSLERGVEPPHFDRFLNDKLCGALRDKLTIYRVASSDSDANDDRESVCARAIERWARVLAEKDHYFDLIDHRDLINQAITGAGPGTKAVLSAVDLDNKFSEYIISCTNDPYQPFYLKVDDSHNLMNSNIPKAIPCPVDEMTLMRDEKIRLFVMLTYFEPFFNDLKTRLEILGGIERAIELGEVSNDEAVVRTLNNIDNYINSDPYFGSHERKDIFRSLSYISEQSGKAQNGVSHVIGQKQLYALSPRVLSMEAYKAKRELVQQRRSCAINEYLRWYYTELLSESSSERRLDHFVYIKSGWGDVSDCTLSVLPLQTNGQEPEAWERLREKLDRNDEMFVYSVEPKNYVQRVSTSTQFNRTMALGAAGQGGIGPQKVHGSASVLNEDERKLDEIENHALVLPLGEGVASLSPEGPHKISFGWAIAPRLLPSTGRPVQVDGTYALSAVISVPSWWRTLKAEYRMCWIDPGHIDELRLHNEAWDSELIEPVCKVTDQNRPSSSDSTKDSGITVENIGKFSSALAGNRTGSYGLAQPSGHADVSSNAENREAGKPSAPDFIRLPHTIPEIYRKLGFELLEVPHLSNQQLSPLVAGYPGDVRLEGERLWRGTDVFLNSQKADRIMVLPDMRGIVAHFNCVLPPIPGPQGASAVVTVVTSEGTDQLAAPVQIEVPADNSQASASTGQMGLPPKNGQTPPAGAAGSPNKDVFAKTQGVGSIGPPPANQGPGPESLTPQVPERLLKRCALVAEIGWTRALQAETEKAPNEDETAKSADNGKKVVEVLMPTNETKR